MLTPYFNIAYVKILLRVFWAKVQRDLLRGKSGRSYIPYSKIAYVKILRILYMLTCKYIIHHLNCNAHISVNLSELSIYVSHSIYTCNHI